MTIRAAGLANICTLVNLSQINSPPFPVKRPKKKLKDFLEKMLKNACILRRRVYTTIK